PLYLPHLGIRPADVPGWTGAIAAISSFVGIPFLPFWGALADRYARQPVIVRSFVAHLLAGILAVLAGNVWVFVLGRAVQSLSLGNSGLMMTTLAEQVPPTRLGFAFAVLNGVGPLGAFAGPLVGGPIVDLWGFPALLTIDIGLMLLVILGMTFGYHDTYQGTDRGGILSMALGSVGLIGRSPRLRTLFPALFLLFAGWMLAFTYITLVVGALYHGPNPATAVGLVLGAGGLVTIVVSPILGALADRFGHWRILFVSAGTSVVLWPLPAFAGDLVTFGIAWAILNGVVSGFFSISFSVLSESAAPADRGRVMSFAYLPVNLGYAVGPALGSLVTQVSLFAVFPAAAVITALGLGVLVVASRQPVTSPAEEIG
ncbi:MAG TPA: MFS transporter, partial [Chloroflexia bacterium]|nr:MFS transporter [Chloroflexia bacterium]